MTIQTPLRTKTCSACGLAKGLDEFYAMTASPDGHGSECKACSNQRVAARRKRDPIERAKFNDLRAQRRARRIEALGQTKADLGCWRCRRHDRAALRWHPADPSATFPLFETTTIDSDARLRAAVAAAVVLCVDCAEILGRPPRSRQPL